MLGFRFPAYVEGIEVAGYHLHFISADRSRGGHVLDSRSRRRCGPGSTPPTTSTSSCRRRIDLADPDLAAATHAAIGARRGRLALAVAAALKLGARAAERAGCVSSPPPSSAKPSPSPWSWSLAAVVCLLAAGGDRRRAPRPPHHRRRPRRHLRRRSAARGEYVVFTVRNRRVRDLNFKIQITCQASDSPTHRTALLQRRRRGAAGPHRSPPTAN